MITNAKQLKYLNAMGIGIWQQKQANEENQPEQTYLAVDLAQLCKQQFFIDLLQSLNITLDQVTLNNPHCLNLGLFNWQFTQSESSQYQNNTLVTPAIEQLKHAPKLKRQLWQILHTALI